MDWLDNYSFDLPPELIALDPLIQREACKLMVVDRKAKRFYHHSFSELSLFLSKEDLLVLNNSKVIPALFKSADEKVSFLFINALDPFRWKVMASPGKYLKKDSIINLKSAGQTNPCDVPVIIKDKLPGGYYILEFEKEINLESLGLPPLPPYIRKLRKKKNRAEIEQKDREYYQTVFAKQLGSIAAPTAGLHFSKEMLENFSTAFITLHVGPATFRPLSVEQLSSGRLEPEYYSIDGSLKEQFRPGRRVVAVGTTVVRVLETIKDFEPQSGWTDLFIFPPFSFKNTHAMITNFHLPKSSLFLLTCAFAGTDLLKEAYKEAIQKGYRFYSYGDAMLII
ncbi:tRNA preQ1(34) S-adenosylmethionine ribosyltransferase-isomerase QueA [Methylacidiphilum caldifontis]|uniref:tRNA preQ1(34) S-adenosylmethionine ribosyltransferase-isomerase QueA n=1 Tax=Methylacidiphilum caldifontis TaxID=2795386 RepID=UPI001A90615E|nr:tRNA preQ1(34) S-adenosylmethionine ribosyltransferase-isomerase QueA [Methylacidiphilum caldifontis]QSR88498.1 tRNA preQ1(34) S-adenosylmethionine ribosyltransferase-isomerase QueA [Methylacidiphilum caldifontis]